MTSWFNLIVSNRIIRGNKLPKWGVPPAKSFNNDGNHGHDVSRRYFIIGFLASASVGRASARARRAARLTHSCSCRPSPHSPGSLRGRAASWPCRPACSRRLVTRLDSVVTRCGRSRRGVCPAHTGLISPSPRVITCPARCRWRRWRTAHLV